VYWTDRRILAPLRSSRWHMKRPRQPKNMPMARVPGKKCGPDQGSCIERARRLISKQKIAEQFGCSLSRVQRLIYQEAADISLSFCLLMNHLMESLSTPNLVSKKTLSQRMHKNSHGSAQAYTDLSPSQLNDRGSCWNSVSHSILSSYCFRLLTAGF